MKTRSVELRVALYARVSSEKQAEANTIASQVAELRRRIDQDGCTLQEDDCFVDDGVSGSILVRPALERLRDQAAHGALDRLYILAPDRLARKASYQALLIDELTAAASNSCFSITPWARVRKTICCCKCRASSPSTNAPRSWNAPAAANATPPAKAA